MPSSEFLLPWLEGDALEERWAGTPSHRDPSERIGLGQRALGGTNAVPGGCCFPFHPVSTRRGGVPGVLLGSCVWPNAF